MFELVFLRGNCTPKLIEHVFCAISKLSTLKENNNNTIILEHIVRENNMQNIALIKNCLAY